MGNTTITDIQSVFSITFTQLEDILKQIESSVISINEIYPNMNVNEIMYNAGMAHALELVRAGIRSKQTTRR